jgi:hypothetical protein
VPRKGAKWLSRLVVGFTAAGVGILIHHALDAPFVSLLRVDR